MSPRVAASLVLVAAGVAVGAAGPAVLLDAAGFVWTHVGVILVVFGGLALMLAVVPRGAVGGPLVLLVLGVGVLLVQSSRIAPASLCALVLVGAGVLFAVDLSRWRDPDMDRRRWAVLVRRDVEPRTAPERIRIVAVGTRMRLDLCNSAPRYGITEILVSVWLGSVEIVVPGDWLVVAGRVSAVRRIDFRGRMTTSDRYEDPSGEDEGSLLELTRELGAPTVAVVHVLGAGGRVTVTHRDTC